ncbi:MAG: twin-arginine translocase TatA/TatE family subunit [Bacteroidota bacterium]
MLLSTLLALPGYGSIILIVLAILLLFGGKKIPELMKGLGRGMKEFKDATKEDGSAESSDSGKETK